jgi:hypothetical protein
MDWNPDMKSSEPELRRELVRVAGAGTGGSATKVLGVGLHVNYISTGIFDLAWSLNDDVPGWPVGAVGALFQATTIANVKGYSLNVGVFSAATRKMRVNLYDGSKNLVDLKALEWVTFEVLFKVNKEV